MGVNRTRCRPGRYSEAKEMAEEAVGIGGALGDEHLRAINLINLGNILAEENLLQDAVGAYQRAGMAAQSCGRRDTEAEASRLAADKLNDIADAQGPGRLEIARQAQLHAEHAIALFKDSFNHYSKAYAFVELGRACAHLGDEIGAGRYCFKAAEEARLGNEPELMSRALLSGSGFLLKKRPSDYIDGLSRALGVTAEKADPNIGDAFLRLAAEIIRRSPRDVTARLLSLHLNELREHLPQDYYDVVAAHLIDAIEESAASLVMAREGWRTLYAGLVLSAFMKTAKNRYSFFRLARVITEAGVGAFARDEQDSTQAWTVVLNLKTAVTISIVSLDASRESQIACLALAAFIKAFEVNLRDDLGITSSKIEELVIYVCNIDQVPESFKTSLEKVGVKEALAHASVVVTRPTIFEGPAMTAMILSSTFLDEIKFGESSGGSLHALFGFSLIEIVYQLLQGEVDEETIRPKVVSLVQQTM